MTIFIGDDTNNILNGGSTADLLNGKGGDDTLNGNGGDDILIGGTGKDTMHGDGGNDTFEVGDQQTAVGEVYDGGSGFDVLTLSTNVAMVDLTLHASFIDSTIQSIEALNFAGSGNIWGQFEAANFASGAFAHNLHLDGGKSTDLITINMQSVTTLDMSGWTFGTWDAAIDVIGNANSETITGSSKGELFVPGGGLDNIHGGGGNDQFFYGGDADAATIDGGSGVDTLTGKGAANDFSILHVSSIEDISFVSGVVSSTETISVLASQFGGGGFASAFGISGDAGFLKVLQIAMGTEVDFSAANFAFAGAANEFMVQITGDGDAETITGSLVSDKLVGLGGADILKGGQGDDQLLGGTGADVLIGGIGSDKLTGGAGADMLTGNAGDDTFIYRNVTDSVTGASTHDVITDFVVGHDKIDVSFIDANDLVGGNQAFVLDVGGSFAAGEFRIAENGSNTILSFSTSGGGAADMQIVLQGVTGVTAADLIL